jgi:glucose-1-phosphate cytidylyltransferase
MSEIHCEYSSVLPCGGKGTRLAELTGELAKPLFKVGGKELISYSVDVLEPEIVRQIVFAVDYAAEALKQWVTDHRPPQKVDFAQQKTPGILGAILEGSRYATEDSFIACNTDEIRQGLNVSGAILAHESNLSPVTMVVTRSTNLSRHRIVEVGDDGLITETTLKPELYENNTSANGLINTGFLIIDKDAIEYFDSGHSEGWSGIIDPLCDAGKINAHIDENITFFNVGTEPEYYETEAYVQQNPVQLGAASVRT